MLDSVITVGPNHRISFHHVGVPLTKYTYLFYRNDFVDGSHFGEGEQICGTATFQTLANGVNDLFVYVPITSPNVFYTATATDSLGNTSEFSQAFCSSDADGDGLPDCWETQGWGIDVNSDGLVDADLYAMGARPDHKDLFVEIDGMLGCMPPAGTAELVSSAFEVVPPNLVSNPDGTGGVHLHAAVSDSFPVDAPAAHVGRGRLDQEDLVRHGRRSRLRERAPHPRREAPVHALGTLGENVWSGRGHGVQRHRRGRLPARVRRLPRHAGYVARRSPARSLHARRHVHARVRAFARPASRRRLRPELSRTT
ncbi:MAG: hypothetical protein IPJ04_17160 [Candidatus Eisenbacteria bacterium]|nr:hypothetical protein [Candidatus Eisenbacteria bacterium]